MKLMTADNAAARAMSRPLNRASNPHATVSSAGTSRSVTNHDSPETDVDRARRSAATQPSAGAATRARTRKLMRAATPSNYGVRSQTARI